jgi:hypothetical protein
MSLESVVAIQGLRGTAPTIWWQIAVDSGLGRDIDHLSITRVIDVLLAWPGSSPALWFRLSNFTARTVRG